jgi:hypothetical protein
MLPTVQAEPITVDKHFSPAFYAELWGVDVSTVVRWFQDREGVLKLGGDRPARGRRTRRELRIPFTLAMQFYQERCR